MTEAALNRYIALHEALGRGRSKPDSTALPFTASALLRTADETAEPRQLVSRTREIHDAIKDRLGGHRAPTGSLRWVYAAMMTARGIDPERFFALREAVRAARKASGTGSIHGGGARAALVLALSDEPTETLVARFYAIKQAIRPPWWRSDVSITDTFAAAHAAEGASPGDITARREQAEQVFAADRHFKHNKREATRLAVLLHASPHQAVAAFDSLREAARSQKRLRGEHDKSMLVAWAVEGLTAADVHAMADISERLPKKCRGAGAPRTRLAHQILTADRHGVPATDVSAMAAVIAAQTAVMVAIMSSTVVATTATAS